jgi:hypothetical protein
MFYKVIVEIIKVESGQDGSDSESEAEWTGEYIEDPPVCYPYFSLGILVTVSRSRAI